MDEAVMQSRHGTSITATSESATHGSEILSGSGRTGNRRKFRAIVHPNRCRRRTARRRILVFRNPSEVTTSRAGALSDGTEQRENRRAVDEPIKRHEEAFP